jgi:hypothetical protein
MNRILNAQHRRGQHGVNRLVERQVRNDNIFCSLLFNRTNRTIRVVDFREGNFRKKVEYLEDVLIAEGMRKVFTLTELAEVSGWKRVGYTREGTIPGYYKRSDAHIMSRIYDDDRETASVANSPEERTAFLADVKAGGDRLSEIKVAGIAGRQAEEKEALGAVKEGLACQMKKSRKSKDGNGAPRQFRPALASGTPLFGHFNRETEHFYWIAQNRRTKRLNVYGVEYQDCFGNAKISMYFTPDTRSDRAVARQGLSDFIDWITGLGAVAVFALVRADDPEQNAIYASSGFRNSGWMSQQMLTDGDPVDQVLWTKKLTGFPQYGQAAK